MKKISAILAACALLLLPSCRFIRISDDFDENVIVDSDEGIVPGESVEPSDNYITRDNVTGEFHSLTCNIPGDVQYVPGDCSVSLYGADNILKHVTVSNENGTLVIKSDGTNFRNIKTFKVNVSSPVLEKADFNGAVDFSAPKGITALDFALQINGAGDIDIQGLAADKASVTVNGAGDARITGIDCETLSVDINGAGDATVAGRATKASLQVSGAGDIDAGALDCNEIESKVRGIGRVERPKN